MNPTGFVLIHRSLIGNPQFRGKDDEYAAMWLILHAAWEPTTIRVNRNAVSLERGQCAYAISYLSQAWECSKATAHARVRFLEGCGFLKTRAERDYTVITVCNYSEYQFSPNANRTQDQTQTERQPNAGRTNKNEGKEGNKGKEETQGVPPVVPPQPEPAMPAQPDGPGEPTPASPAQRVQAQEISEKSKRGTRLPEGSQLPSEWAAWAREQGVPNPQALWDEFHDYWISVPGQKGVKLNWQATWQNRVRAWLERNPPRNGGGGPNGPRPGGQGQRPSTADVFDMIIANSKDTKIRVKEV